MSEPYIGEIKMAGFNFAPIGYALCNGQILSIAQNTALFSLLGTTFGGNGQTTFALPNLQGRVPMHWGQGAGLTNRVLGETAGSENTTLIVTNIPAHAHTFAVPAVNETGNSNSPDPAHSLAAPHSDVGLYSGNNPDNTLRPGNTGLAGGSQPFNNMQPYQVVTFIIALEGVYPSRP
jgi:microcystin-dependent protein